MITRIWHGKTKAKHANSYLKFLKETGLKEYLATKGIASAKILRRVEGDVCHFCTVSEWVDLESIKRFAGDEYEKARYYSEDNEYLLEFEETVEHYETFL